jgi:hypothetical protein
MFCPICKTVRRTFTIMNACYDCAKVIHWTNEEVKAAGDENKRLHPRE